jgi:hypothetical protein
VLRAEYMVVKRHSATYIYLRLFIISTLRLDTTKASGNPQLSATNVTIGSFEVKDSIILGMGNLQLPAKFAHVSKQLSSRYAVVAFKSKNNTSGPKRACRILNTYLYSTRTANDLSGILSNITNGLFLSCLGYE